MAVNENLKNFMKKVDHHLNVEVALIQDWDGQKTDTAAADDQINY
jgi:hypothetical protein